MPHTKPKFPFALFAGCVILVMAAVIGLFMKYVPRMPGPDIAAPAFRGDDQNGKFVSLYDDLKYAPVLAVFIHPDDPASRAQLPYAGLFDKGYGDKLKVFGVVFTSLKEIPKWASENHVSFSIIADPEQRTIQAYKVKESMTVVLIDKNTEMIKRWTGLSRANLRDINQECAKLIRAQPANIDWDTAPEKPKPGKSF